MARKQTLVNNLELDNVDNGERRHSLACSYLCEPKIQEFLCSFINVREEPKHNYAGRCTTRTEYNPGIAGTEVPLLKGSGKSRSIVGFIDVIISPQRTDRNKFEGGRTRKDKPYIGTPKIVIEVKINKVDIGNIVKQISLYKQYLDEPWDKYWFLAVDFPLTDKEKKRIEQAGIFCFKLGKKFDEYCDPSDNVEDAEVEEI